MVVPRVMPLVLSGLLIAQMVTLVSKLEAQALLELGAQYWWGYLPSSTREVGLFFGLLTRMPASTILLMLAGGSLCLPGTFTSSLGTLYFNLAIPIFCICKFSSSSLRPLISLLLLPYNSLKIMMLGYISLMFGTQSCNV